MEELQKKKMSALAGALAFIRSYEGIDAIVIGVVSAHELKEIVETWTQVAASTHKAELKWAWNNVMDLDPRRWAT